MRHKTDAGEDTVCMVGVGRLILFAGPPCSGKSTTIEDLRAGKLPALSERLEIGDLSAWQVIEAMYLHKVREPRVGRVLFHYDFLRRWERKWHVYEYEEDWPLGVLDASVEVTFVTLWATPDTLIRRLQLREANLRKSLLAPNKVLRKIERIRRLIRLYSDPPELYLKYDKWFGFCGKYSNAVHWIMDTTESVGKIAPVSAWSDVRCVTRN